MAAVRLEGCHAVEWERLAHRRACSGGQPARTGPARRLGAKLEFVWDGEAGKVVSPSLCSRPSKPSAQEALLWAGVCYRRLSENCVIYIINPCSPGEEK